MRISRVLDTLSKPEPSGPLPFVTVLLGGGAGALKTRLILILMAVVLAGALAQAQSHKGQAKWRTVKGTVVNWKGDPIGSALLYLKDPRADNEDEDY